MTVTRLASQKKAIVIGATGQVGSILVDKLAKSPDYSTVVATFRHEKDRDNLAKMGSQPQKLDLTNMNDVSQILKGAHDVFFTAGSGGRNVQKIDRDGAIEIGNALSNLDTPAHFVLLSSIGVDQASKMGELEEYGKAKKEADDHILDMANMKATILRPGALTNEEAKNTVILGPVDNKSLLDRFPQEKVKNTWIDVAETLLQCASLYGGDPESRVIEMINGNDEDAGKAIAEALQAFA